MAPTIPCGEPDRAVAGDTWKWTTALTDYPVSEGWVLSYEIVSITDAAQAPLAWVDAWVTDDGSTWTVAIPAAATAALAEGTYRRRKLVTLAGERYTVQDALFVVEGDLSAAAAGDEVDETEALILKVRAELSARITGDGSAFQSYQVGDRALGLIPLEELRSLLASLEAKVSRLRHPGRFGRTIFQRYRRASGAPRDGWTG